MGPVSVSQLWGAFEVGCVFMFVLEVARLNITLAQSLGRPGVLLPLSFLMMIVFGTLLLKLPAAVPPGQALSWVDALFTMTSAVCVTGLIVRDTATQFTPVGQFVIAVFIQLGGIGILVFGSMLTLLLGARLTLRENLSLADVLHEQRSRNVVPVVRFIVVMTVVVELAGAALLWPLWPAEVRGWERAGLSAFHSVSAYCNAGFSLRSDSLEGFRYAGLTHLVVLPLIVVGGLGYPVVHNLLSVVWGRVRRGLTAGGRAVRVGEPVDLSRTRLSLHTKVVLVTTAVVYTYGVLGIAAGQLKPHVDAVFEQGQTAHQERVGPLDLRTAGGVLADASFMSVSARTAGFNTMPMDELSPTGRFVVMSLMVIGASPGGTGGGMKTTTFALLALTVVATARQREVTEAFGRTINDGLVRKAATLAASFLMLVAVATGLLSLSEPYPFGKILFEAISAASTTGLSLGITGDLTLMGKLVIIATMFLGRVGPLALLAVLFFGSGRTRPYAYPQESVYMS